MDQLSRTIRDRDYITKVDLKARFQLMRMAMGYGTLTAFRTMFGLYK
jgi:hypothetical protein